MVRYWEPSLEDWGHVRDNDCHSLPLNILLELVATAGGQKRKMDQKARNKTQYSQVIWLCLQYIQMKL